MEPGGWQIGANNFKYSGNVMVGSDQDPHSKIIRNKRESEKEVWFVLTKVHMGW